ncbi:hypothetical protein Tco_0914187 [Tanacetum coccineum]
MEDGRFFKQSKYIKEMLKKFELEDSKPTKTPMSMEIKLTKDDKADSALDQLEKTLEQNSPYNSTIPFLDDIRNVIHIRTTSEKQTKQGIIQKLPNQIETNELLEHLKPCELVIGENVYADIENRDHVQASISLMLYCLETRRPYNLAYFIIMRMYNFRDRFEKVLPYGMILTRVFRNLKANIENHPFDERYVLVPRIMSSLKAKQPKRPPPKRTKNVGKSKREQLSSTSSSESPPSDNEDLPSTKLSPMSYNRALPICTNMSNDQKETRGMFKKIARALHKFA